MFKVDDKTYQSILEAVSKCATNCFFKGVKYQQEGQEGQAVQLIKEEYVHCSDEIFKALGGQIKQ